MKYATHYGIPEVIDDAVVVSLYTLYETVFNKSNETHDCSDNFNSSSTSSSRTRFLKAKV